MPAYLGSGPWVQAAAQMASLTSDNPGIPVWAPPILAGIGAEVRKKIPRTVQAEDMCAPPPDPDSRSEPFTKVSPQREETGQAYRLQQLTHHGTAEFHHNRFGRSLGLTIPVSCFTTELVSPQLTTKRQLLGPQQLPDSSPPARVPRSSSCSLRESHGHVCKLPSFLARLSSLF